MIRYNFRTHSINIRHDDEGSHQENRWQQNIHDLDNPKQLMVPARVYLGVGSAFEFEPLHSILIVAEVPSQPEHLAAVDILGKPKINDDKGDDQLKKRVLSN